MTTKAAMLHTFNNKTVSEVIYDNAELHIVFTDGSEIFIVPDGNEDEEYWLNVELTLISKDIVML